MNRSTRRLVCVAALAVPLVRTPALSSQAAPEPQIHVYRTVDGRARSAGPANRRQRFGSIPGASPGTACRPAATSSLPRRRWVAAQAAIDPGLTPSCSGLPPLTSSQTNGSRSCCRAVRVRFLDEQHVAEVPPRGHPGTLGRFAPVDSKPRFLIQMEADFLIQFDVSLRASEQSGEPCHRSAPCA